MNSKKLCTLMTIAYHMLFLGGSTTIVNGYLEKIEALEKEIRTQGDKARKSVDDVTNVAQKLDKSIKSIKKVCGSLM
tara:strand:+ start:629 stop:859 length:231 start_codon:yes stop_codon:yes gene_type:complete